MKRIISLLIISVIFSCGKKLDLKPDSDIVQPATVKDFENLLDNTEVMNSTPGLAQISADEYFIPDLQSWQAISSVTQRNAYLWLKDLFGAETKIKDWSAPYTTVFYSNSVIDLLAKKDISNDLEMQHIQGRALFSRAYAFYALVSTFSKAYDAATAATDLGVPLKLSSAIDETQPRSSVQATYDQIIKDALAAGELLEQNFNPEKKNRPSQVAAFAFLARVYLSMRKYDLAEWYADKAMNLYAVLVDFNTLPITNRSSFTVNSVETIYYSQQIMAYSSTTVGSAPLYGIDPLLINLYEPKDLRLKIYFKLSPVGHAIIKGINSIGYPFTGLATDELYLIKAECLARRQQKDDALLFLNTLVKTRYVSGGFKAITAANSSMALDKILTERRKALIWRSLRWTDLKRLNLEGRDITLRRNVEGQMYSLAPNSPLYVMPIPLDEILLSKIQQNIR